MRGDLHRALTKMTLDLHRKIERRKQIELHYGNHVREQQFQYPFNGYVGMLPSETTVVIKFDICFLWDPGVAVDSQLGEPTFRFGARLLSAPQGTIPYAHVPSWIQDDDLNYIGANVVIGVHNPAQTLNEQVESVPFNGVAHFTFQGYGFPIDPMGSGPDGGVPFS